MISDDEIESFLAHHGVKGQKWGIRNLKKKHDARAAERRAKSGPGPKKGFHRDGTVSTAEKTALIAAGGAAAFVILQRIGLRILL